MTELDIERDRMIRADGVYARIEVLSEDLTRAAVVADWLRLQLNAKDAQVASLQDEIQALHAKRNAIFHEGDE